jgi:very-short-patch-repair endonuclease
MQQTKPFENLDYNPSLKSFAVDLHKNMTKAEACLWKYVLKGKKMKGFHFNRQRPVLGYIADFMCKELRLIIEVDGITHHWEETIRKDEKRQKDLEEAGFFVMRFTDDEVLRDINNVIMRLENWIEGKILPLPSRKIGTSSPEGDILPLPSRKIGTSSPKGDKRAT